MPDRLGSFARSSRVAFLALVAGSAAALAQTASTPGAVVSDSSRPNVVVVMTDDQTAGQMRALPRTKQLLGGGGTTFSRFYVTQPQCCPSRASYLTGQYPHNTGVQDNDGGFRAFQDAETLPVWLDRAGYRTMLIGKYFNGYGLRDPYYIPPGWDGWAASIGQLSMYDYGLNENGVLTHYGTDELDYKTDVYARKARAFVSNSIARGKQFYLHVSAPPPHTEGGISHCAANPRPAPRHEGVFSSEPLPKPPSYNELDVSDKPQFVQDKPEITPEQELCIRQRWRAGLESLLSVDQMVASLVRRLENAGELDQTLFVFTSDNGFFYGEHRFQAGKNQVYEEATRVPLLIRGPGFPAGVTRHQLAANIDIAPTILDATGTAPGHVVDGRSLLPLAVDPSEGSNRKLLIESRERYFSLRTDRWLYSINLNFENQLYDMQIDPYQLGSLHNDPAYQSTLTGLRAELEALKGCAGPSCR